MAGYRCDTTGKVTIDIGIQQTPVLIIKNLRYAKESGTWKAYANQGPAQPPPPLSVYPRATVLNLPTPSTQFF